MQSNFSQGSKQFPIRWEKTLGCEILLALGEKDF